MFFKRRRGNAAAAAVAERPADGAELFAEIDRLNAANRAGRDPETEVRIRRLRNLAGMELLTDPPSDPRYVQPATELPDVDPVSRCPEISPEQLTPALLRGAILRDGCLLIRGLMDGEKAERLATDIDRSFELRSTLAEGESDPEGFYDELIAEPPYQIAERSWVEDGGGVLAVDSPRMLFDMLESFEHAGLRSVIEDYLGERPAISGQKCTLRKATPDVPGGWHQDGRFMGDVRSLNVWISLSHCGEDAPSMDVVPTRLEEFVTTGGEGTQLSVQIGQRDAEAAAAEVGIVRPIFRPGDALLFDHLFLHKTGSDPSMPNPRYAIESWFFGPSAYPEHYVPIAF